MHTEEAIKHRTQEELRPHFLTQAVTTLKSRGRRQGDTMLRERLRDALNGGREQNDKSIKPQTKC